MSKKQAENKNSSGRIIVLLVVLVALFIGSFALAYRFAVYSGENDEDVIINIDPEKGILVDIPYGASTETIVNVLEENELVKHPLIFKILSNLNGYDGTYKSGVHRLSRDLEYIDMMKVISSNPESLKVRVKEGSTVSQLADELVKSNIISSKEKFIEAVNTEMYTYKFLEGLPERENRLEGYLFPDTYEFALKVQEKDVIKLMLNNFNDRFKPDYYDKAKKLGLTVDKVIIVASILEKEASSSKERAMIAQVLYNRLNSKDKSLRKIGSCATIQYIYFNRKTDISDADKKRIAEGRITDKDTAIDDPYNTYKYEGLPAGPICSPSKSSIEAALNPDSEAKDYLFFVAKGDGTHAFSKTYAEHEANRRKYEQK